MSQFDDLPSAASGTAPHAYIDPRLLLIDPESLPVRDSAAGAKEETGIVPQYDRIEPSGAAIELLNQQSDISPRNLLEQLLGKKVTSREDAGNRYLSAYLKSREPKMTLQVFLKNYAHFSLEREKVLEWAQERSGETRKSANGFLSSLEQAVFGKSPVAKRFEKIVEEKDGNPWRELQTQLVKRWNINNKELEVDAFVNAALVIKKQTQYQVLIGLLSHRPKVYELDGDTELSKAFGEMTGLKQDNARKERLGVTVTLPEIAHLSKIPKDRLFTAIQEWSQELNEKDYESPNSDLAMIKDQWPTDINSRHFKASIRQIALGLRP